jgi:hypothetical protein
VAKKLPEYLRLHIDEAAEHSPSASHAASPLAELCRAFQRATGWRLAYVDSPGVASEAWSAPIEGQEGKPVGRLILEPPVARVNGDRAESAAASTTSQGPGLRGLSPSHPCDLEQARPLALAVARMLGEINQLKRAVWEREAELAAGVPVTVRPDEEEHLAQRLTSVLQSGA